MDLKKELEPYLEELEENYDIIPILYEDIELMLKYDVANEPINNWLSINQDAILFVREKIEKIKNSC